ncbi:hypothetical protein R3P38DRAFT_2788485 [Favolaschia claudopus]|uniref:Uncharacterized protein n=1 Tax=Favolaschia claudopus TaxID=2862362 RepID=A0AAW0AM35_9AGAR
MMVDAIIKLPYRLGLRSPASRTLPCQPWADHPDPKKVKHRGKKAKMQSERQAPSGVALPASHKFFPSAIERNLDLEGMWTRAAAYNAAWMRQYMNQERAKCKGRRRGWYDVTMPFERQRPSGVCMLQHNATVKTHAAATISYCY